MHALNILFVAHGSSFATYRSDAESFVAAWRDMFGSQHTNICYLELLKPSFYEVFHQLDEPTIVMPLFLHEGWHLRKDITETISSSSKAVTILPPLTTSLALMEVFRDRLDELKSEHEAVIIYSHGNRATEKQIHLYKLSMEFQVKLGIKCSVAVSKGEPSLSLQLSRLVDQGVKHITILPHFLFSGVWQGKLESQINEFSLASDVQISIAQPLNHHIALLAEISNSLSTLE